MSVTAPRRRVWTRKQLRERLDILRRVAADDEVAHGVEDQIREEALRQIFARSTDAESRSIARLALQTGDVQFERWLA